MLKVSTYLYQIILSDKNIIFTLHYVLILYFYKLKYIFNYTSNISSGCYYLLLLHLIKFFSGSLILLNGFFLLLVVLEN